MSRMEAVDWSSLSPAGASGSITSVSASIPFTSGSDLRWLRKCSGRAVAGARTKWMSWLSCERRSVNPWRLTTSWIASGEQRRMNSPSSSDTLPAPGIPSRVTSPSSHARICHSILRFISHPCPPLSHGIEADTDVMLPEAPAGLRLDQSTASILDMLRNRSVVPFYGNPVLSSYVNQPAVMLIRSAEAHQLATGAGIVAVIDTGVDPNHSVLKASLVPGFDFTRNLPGIPSEFADLGQSTASILDQSTTSILDHQTILMLNQSTATILHH